MNKFKRTGDATEEDGTVLAHWRREPDPVYAEGRFRVWMRGDEPDDGRSFFPLYMSKEWVREEIEKRKGGDLTM